MTKKKFDDEGNIYHEDANGNKFILVGSVGPEISKREEDWQRLEREKKLLDAALVENSRKRQEYLEWFRAWHNPRGETVDG